MGFFSNIYDFVTDIVSDSGGSGGSSTPSTPATQSGNQSGDGFGFTGSDAVTAGSSFLNTIGNYLIADENRELSEQELEFLKQKFGQELALQYQQLAARERQVAGELESAKNDRVQRAFQALLGSLARGAEIAPNQLQGTASLVTRAVRG